MTDEKIFIPAHVPQGSSDSTAYFQQNNGKLLSSFPLLAPTRLGDDLLFADNIDTYLEKYCDVLFPLFAKIEQKINGKECNLYQTELKWCGKIFEVNGMRQGPARINTLRAISYPSTSAQLQQLIGAANWMRKVVRISLTRYHRYKETRLRSDEHSLY